MKAKKQLMIIIPSIVVAIAIAVTAFITLTSSSAEADSGRSVSAAKGIDPYEDPQGFLQAALSAAGEDIALRYSGSPITAVRESMSGNDLSTNLSILSDNEDYLNGTAYINRDDAELWFDGILSSQGVETSYGFYCDENFIGLSCPYIFGDNTLYGMRPYKAPEEMDESIIGNILSEDSKRLIEGIKSVLELMTITDYRNELAEDFSSLYEDFTLGMEFDIEKRTVSIADTEYDGFSFTGVYDSNAISDYTDATIDILGSNESIQTLIDLYNGFSGENVSIDNIVERFLSDGTEITVTYYIADYRVSTIEVHVTNANQVTSDTEIDLYYSDETGISVDVETSDDSEKSAAAKYTTNVDSSEGYAERMSLTFNESGEESCNIVNSLSWDDDGTLTVTSENTGGESMTVKGKLTVEKDDGFTLENTAINLNDGVNSNTLNISLDGRNDVQMPETPDKVNIFQMAEAELFNFIQHIVGLTESDVA